MTETLTLVGSSQFRARLVCSLLSRRAIRIISIRENSSKPGVTPAEVEFLKLLEELTDGSSFSINVTGTVVTCKPGIINGGQITFNCGANGRGVMYFVEGILPILLFARHNSTITFNGITEHEMDTSVEIFNNCVNGLLAKFSVEDSVTLKLVRRSVGVVGDKSGCVVLQCNIIKELKACEVIDPGLVKRIRGLAFSLRVSPQFTNRMVDASRKIFNNFLPDVYISTDSASGMNTKEFSLPGYGINLYAISNNGTVHTSKAMSTSGDKTPEEIGDFAARRLCEEMIAGGCVDSAHQTLVLLLMVLCRDVSKVRMGPLTEYSIVFLRLLKEIFGVKFKIVSDTTSVLRKEDDISPLMPQTGAKSHENSNSEMSDESDDESKNDDIEDSIRAGLNNRFDTVLLSCKGIGYTNISRTVT